MAGTALEGLDGVGLEDEEPFGAVPTPEEVRESLRSAPRPTTPVKYNLAEAEFWRLRHVPAGSVLLFKDPRSDPADDASVAVLVLSTESLDRGVWVTVKVVGGSEEESKKRAQKFFRSGKRKLHLCNLDRDGMCMDVETEGLHLTQFEWFPPGDFSASWVSATGRKAIKDGKTMALEEEKKRRQEEERKGPPADGERPHTSRVEERLRSLARPSTLRTSGRHVSFPGLGDAPDSGGDGAGRRATSKAGPVRRESQSRSLVAYAPMENGVKTEVIDVDTESENKSKKKKKSASLGESLAKAAKTQVEPKESERKRRRSRSRSRSRKSKKKKKRRESSSRSRSRSRSSTSSSDESLLPPLQRKAQRSPGAVFRMLEEHMAERLSQDAALEVEEDGSGPSGARPRFQTYFQLCLRPQLDPRSRDCKELSLLARSLDLLRGGRLERLADLLAARLIAVDTATRQGWQTARYLEIDNDADEGSAPPTCSWPPSGMGAWSKKQAAKAAGQSSGEATNWEATTKERRKGRMPRESQRKEKEKERDGKRHGSPGAQRRETKEERQPRRRTGSDGVAPCGDLSLAGETC